VIEPLRFSLMVDCPPDHAFKTWTEKASAWWPHEHTASGERGLAIVFEPRPGGRIFERTVDGREIEWGEVVSWEPPHRLAYRWRIAIDPDGATDVEIRFLGSGGRTAIEIEHSGWERLAERGRSWRDVNHGGWAGVLPAYVSACRTGKS
jgi:uncharacterized protein YndB with AHSA1/START domain